jgi:hypothetical protein
VTDSCASELFSVTLAADASRASLRKLDIYSLPGKAKENVRIDSVKIEDQMNRTERLLSDALGYTVSLKPVRLKKREQLEKQIGLLRKRQIERITRGRTRGAGAGGFNRDIENISHKIRLLEIQLADLNESI